MTRAPIPGPNVGVSVYATDPVGNQVGVWWIRALEQDDPHHAGCLQLLVVNVASAFGFTPQFTAIETACEKYKDKRMVIVGVPGNNFESGAR